MSFCLKNSSPRGGWKGASFGKTELALLYNPHLSPSHARWKLMHWINRNRKLKKRLKDLGYNTKDRIFSPKMVEAIFEELCEP